MKGIANYLYPKLGLQVDFNPKTRLVRALSFHRNGVNGYKQSPAETVEGLAPGATKRKVLDILGTPDKSNSVASSARGWVWYQQGIQFDFNEDGIVDSASLAEVWLAADHFYDVLERWRKSFDDEWASLPKVAADTAG